LLLFLTVVMTPTTPACLSTTAWTTPTPQFVQNATNVATKTGAAISPSRTRTVTTMPDRLKGIGAKAAGSAAIMQGTVRVTGRAGKRLVAMSPAQQPAKMQGKMFPPTMPKPRQMAMLTSFPKSVPKSAPRLRLASTWCGKKLSGSVALNGGMMMFLSWKWSRRRCPASSKTGGRAMSPVKPFLMREGICKRQRTGAS